MRRYLLAAAAVTLLASPWVIRRRFPLLPEYDSLNEFVCENNRDYKPLFGKQ